MHPSHLIYLLTIPPYTPSSGYAVSCFSLDPTSLLLASTIQCKWCMHHRQGPALLLDPWTPKILQFLKTKYVRKLNCLKPLCSTFALLMSPIFAPHATATRQSLNPISFVSGGTTIILKMQQLADTCTSRITVTTNHLIRCYDGLPVGLV